MTRCLLALAVVACSSSSKPAVDAAGDGAYHCTVTQMRCGGGEKWPPGFDHIAGGSTFTLAIGDASIAVTDVAPDSGPVIADAFECTGTWTGTMLACTLPTGTSCTGGSVTDVPFAVVTSGTNPNTQMPLAPDEIWAGEWPNVPASNLSSVCTY